jgi:Flp pilus assembly protein TadD
MQRCPNCNARCDGNSICRRCGMDLTLLIRAERAAARLARQALTQLAAEDTTSAERTLREAQALHRTPRAEQLLGVIRQQEARARAAFTQRHRILAENPWD